MEENKTKKSNFLVVTIIAIAAVIIGFLLGSRVSQNNKKQDIAINQTTIKTVENTVKNDTISDNINEVKGNEISDFDLSFLKLENEKSNKVYSPLSIKYALKMLEEGANGETKNQISKIIGSYTPTKYSSNKNMSLANALFIRDDFKDSIKQNYINILKNKYEAEVRFDSFQSAESINNWIREKTLNIIPEMVQDDDLNNLEFALINALAIDMEWEEKFILQRGFPSTEYLHEQNIDVCDIEQVSSNTFKNDKNEMKVSGMHIEATINNYDIIKELGEDNIKKIVSDEYRKFVKGEKYDNEHAGGDFPLSDSTTDEGIKKDLDEFLPNYIEELKENYHKSGSSTDFSVYVDDNVKVFAKDLKEYDGTTLQYVGIMPIKTDLDKFITNLDSKTILNYIKNLKNIDYRNFDEGVATKITGYIPKFNFEYSLDLMEDLKQQNITDIFDSDKSDLSGIAEGNENYYIGTALHKANIEFTQDGIKAAAATLTGGLGAGMPFDYFFDVPTQEIDLTFDKPYMFLVRDKETGETWFAGTVYEPLLWDNDETKEEYLW